MGVYSERVLPRIINVACGAKTADVYRKRVCSGLHGDVVEIGFGSGLNVPFYPGSVDDVAAVEPATLGWKLAARRVGASSIPIRQAGLDGQSLPFDDDSFDCAVSTWTMCTIPDLDAAMSEIKRVLRPGGTLHFIEHGLAPDPSVQTWQRRLEPLQKKAFGGCHLTRQIPQALEGAGFEMTELDQFYAEKEPKFFGAYSLGVARPGPNLV